jgi:hypothetical protein
MSVKVFLFFQRAKTIERFRASFAGESFCISLNIILRDYMGSARLLESIFIYSLSLCFVLSIYHTVILIRERGGKDMKNKTATPNKMSWNSFQMGISQECSYLSI